MSSDRKVATSSLLAFLAIVGFLLYLIFSDANARERLEFAPTWVLLIEPPKPTDCVTLGWMVTGPTGSDFNAATVLAMPDALGAELTPLTTSGPVRVYCDGFE